MKRDKQIEIGETLLRYIERGTTSLAEAPMERSAEAYSDEKRFQREKQLFFRSTPLVIGLSSELALPGDYITCEDTGIPIVVMRQKDGGLSAFVNICRHRGARLITEARGRQRSLISCPYHGWTYNSSGSLIRIPYAEGFAGMDTRKRGLIPMPVAEKHGLVMIVGDQERGADIDNHLGPLGDELRTWKLDAYHYAKSRSLPSATNWKLAIDSFTEGYHFSILHKDTIAKLTHTNVMHYERLGMHYRLAFPAFSISELKSFPTKEWQPLRHISFVYYIYPNVSITMSHGTHRTARIFRILPGRSVGESLTIHTAYSADPLTSLADHSLFAQHFDTMHDVIANEDYAVGAGAQRSMSNGVLQSFIFGRNEPSLIHIHSQLDAVLMASGGN